MAGPSVVLGYLIGGGIIYLVLVSLGHLALKYKDKESFRGYVQESVGPVGGFIAGWAAWFTAVVSMVAEAIAMSIYTRLWFPWLPLWLPSLVYGILAAGINFFGIKIVDKSEGALTFIKTGTLLVFMLTVGYFIFRTPHVSSAGIGTANLIPFFPRGAGGFMQATVICTFAYGISAFGAATGDTRNPRRDIPRATWGMTAGQIFFFTVPTLVLLLAVPWTAISTRSSPFVTALNHIGIHLGGNILNSIVLISSFSSLVGSMFTAVIMLSTMAQDREAPAFLAKKWNNFSLYALLVSAVTLLVLTLLVQILPHNIYNYAVTTTGYFSFIIWGSILLARLMLCLPHKNKGRMEWRGLTTTALGLAAIFLISVLSLRAPEQKYSFILTMGILFALIVVGKSIVRKNGAKEKGPNGQKQNITIDERVEEAPLLQNIKRKLR